MTYFSACLRRRHRDTDGQVRGTITRCTATARRWEETRASAAELVPVILHAHRGSWTRMVDNRASP